MLFYSATDERSTLQPHIRSSFWQCEFMSQTRFDSNMYINDFEFSSVMTNRWDGARMRTGKNGYNAREEQTNEGRSL